MTFAKHILLISMFSVASAAQAVSLLSDDINEQTVYAGADNNEQLQLTAVQAQLAAIQTPEGNQLATTMTVSTTLEAGVYHAAGLTTTAGITLTFDGKGQDGLWLINVDSHINFGANLTMELIDVTDTSTIIFNAVDYTVVGANSKLVGAFFAGDYVVTGATVALQGVGGACGGIFTTTGTITLGTDNDIGGSGCSVGAVNNLSFDGIGQPVLSSSVVPVPATAWLFGSALIGLAGVARRKK
jgi:hypothetical protein